MVILLVVSEKKRAPQYKVKNHPVLIGFNVVKMQSLIIGSGPNISKIESQPNHPFQ